MSGLRAVASPLTPPRGHARRFPVHRACRIVRQPMSPLTQSLIATFLVSAISLVGVVFLFAEWTERRAMLFISFAAGVLLATAFLEMFPEAVQRRQDGGNFFAASLAAMGAFFLLERFLFGFHTHEDSHVT